MAKSELMRPSWVCLKLCNGDTLATTLLAEIIFKANVTKYQDAYDNRIVVFSYEEWADITGLSRNQVRKALKRLSDLNIVKVYNKKHPHKTVLRALHVEVSHALWELWHCLTSGGYKFERDILCPKQGHTKFKFNVAACGNTEVNPSDDTILSPDNTLQCPTGTHLSTYKKDYKEDLMAVAQKSATAEEEIQEKVSKKVQEKEGSEVYEIHDSLKVIKTLPALLMALHHHYIKYFWNFMDGTVPDDLTAIKRWADNLKEIYCKSASAPDDTFVGLFILLREELGAGLLPLIDKTLSNWDKFTQHVAAHYSLGKLPPVPDIAFFYYFRRHAVSLNVGPHVGTESLVA